MIPILIFMKQNYIWTSKDKKVCDKTLEQYKAQNNWKQILDMSY